MAAPPEDVSGSRSANRFDYQLDWALLHIIELFPNGENFVVVLDFFDDVIVLDSDADPTSIVCYQIKTRDSGSWTIDALLKRPRVKAGLGRSIIGKLYSHVVRWGADVAGLRFASNASLSEDLQDGASANALDSVRFTTLNAAQIEKLSSSLRTELALTEPIGDRLALFEFKRSTLGATGHQDQCIGVVARFLETRPETAKVPSAAFYRTIKAEMARAVQREGCPTTFLELCRSKSLTRARFAQMLSDAAAEPTRADHAETLVARLNAEQVPFQDVQAVQSLARSLVIRRLNPTDQMLHDDIQAIRTCCVPDYAHPRLWDSIESVRDAIAQARPEISRRHGIHGLRAVIGVLLLEQAQLQGVNPPPPEEAT